VSSAPKNGVRQKRPDEDKLYTKIVELDEINNFVVDEVFI